MESESLYQSPVSSRVKSLPGSWYDFNISQVQIDGRWVHIDALHCTRDAVLVIEHIGDGARITHPVSTVDFTGAPTYVIVR